LLISPGYGFDSYLWQDSTFQNYYLINKKGLYWIEVKTQNGCVGRDSILVDYYIPQEISLGKDTNICPNETILLSPGNDFSNYLWQDGSTNSTFLVKEDGTYWVMAQDSLCYIYDTIVVYPCIAPYDIYVPNAFTPNNDGFNDYYHVIANNITDYKIFIYNRWGEEIFSSNSFLESWNGKFKGKECPVGVYFYIIYYKPAYSNSKKILKGSITLLK
jgi:gliding motility-associated-like protein